MNAVRRTLTVRFTVLAALAAVLLAVAACSGVPGVGGDTATSFTVRMADGGISVPQGVGAGVSTFTFDNASEAEFGPVLARLNQGVTMDQLMTLLSEEGEEAAMSQLTLLGGTMMGPMSTMDISYELEEGDYLIIDFASDDEDTPIAPFSVEAGGASGEEPEADVTAELQDFTFNLTGEVTAAPQIWEITNTGAEWHEMFIIPVESGMNESQVIEMLMQMQGPDDVPEGSFGWMPMHPETRAWASFDLEPGSYAVVCMLPSFANEGTPHAMLGMVRVVEVAE